MEKSGFGYQVWHPKQVREDGPAVSWLKITNIDIDILKYGIDFLQKIRKCSQMMYAQH